VYYFGITLPEKDVAYLNDVKFAAMHLQIAEVFTLDDETLYRIRRN
jgi:hypothetical protein